MRYDSSNRFISRRLINGVSFMSISSIVLRNGGEWRLTPSPPPPPPVQSRESQKSPIWVGLKMSSLLCPVSWYFAQHIWNALEGIWSPVLRLLLLLYCPSTTQPKTALPAYWFLTSSEFSKSRPQNRPENHMHRPPKRRMGMRRYKRDARARNKTRCSCTDQNEMRTRRPE